MALGSASCAYSNAFATKSSPHILYQGEFLKYSLGLSEIHSFTTSHAYTTSLYRLTTVVICSFRRFNNNSFDAVSGGLWEESINIQRGAWLCQQRLCPLIFK